jgi:hypothetical protein
MTNDPVLIAYAVKRRTRGKHPVWTRIGKAYPHDEGAGLTVVLDAIPPDGRIMLLEPGEDDDDRLLRESALLRSRRGRPASD